MHITAQLDVDVVCVEQEDSVTVMLELQAPESESTATRLPQAAVVVLDRSGSMAGPRLHAAQRALISLIDRLADDDLFGLVVFDHESQLLIPADSVKALGREAVQRAIASIHPGGSTDLSSGYLRGLQEARRVAAPAGTTVIVLSDGHANQGITDPASFRQMAAGAVAQRITTSTIGIGLGYDDQILSEQAIGGAGNHTFAEEADAAAAAVAAELDGLLSKTVQAASLLITAEAPVSTISILNDLPSQGLTHGVLVELGDFYAGETRRVLTSLAVPAMAGLGLAQVATLQLNYVSIPALHAHTVTLPISVNVVPEDVAKGRVPNAEVHKEKLILDAQAAKRSSEQALRRGDSDAAKADLDRSLTSLEQADQAASSPELRAEIEFMKDAIRDLEFREASYTSRKLSADRTKKSRGLRDRTQGGEWEG